MKFTIRFADQIVGAFIILAFGIVIFAILMMGFNQRWFSRDYYFKSYFPSATGLSKNMVVQYKGFTIGHVKSTKLIRRDENDQVEVRFTIFDTYIDRVRHGSLVDVSISPLAALGGNSFTFYPGTGELMINEGEKVIEEKTIPWAGSVEGKFLLNTKLAQLPERDDSISNIINSVGLGVTITTLNSLLADVQEALAGTDRTGLGQIVGNLNATVAELRPLPGTVDNTLTKQLDPLLSNLKEFSSRVNDPDGTVAAILDSEGKIYKDLVETLSTLSVVMRNLEKTTDFMPAQLQSILVSVDDVLIALTNNPLLKKGVPERKETNTGGTYNRDLEF
jgi:phospholipid/cholesterol/gamma-HCH transport system substrate-binding protein